MGSFLARLHNLFTDTQAESSADGPAAPMQAQSVQVPTASLQVSGSGRLADAKAPAGQEFDIHEGPEVATVHELAEALTEAPDETFAHHMHTDGSNDFARWIRDVFSDPAAADLVNAAGNPAEIVLILRQLS